ncbi:MAG TPA: HAMP domain-containing protein [Candidatus Aquicultor sp.]|jgi:HAMP domain-containing protein
MKEKRTYSIRTKLLIASIVLSLVPLAILGLTGTANVKGMGNQVSKQVSNEVATQAKSQLLSESKNTTDQVKLLHEQYKNDISTLNNFPGKEAVFAARMAGGNWKTSPAKTTAEKYFEKFWRPDMSMVRFFYKDGFNITKIEGGKASQEGNTFKGDTVWFMTPMNAKLVPDNSIYISALNISGSTGEAEIRYSMPVTINGQRVGLTQINFMGNAITKVVADTKFGKSGYAFMIDKKYQETDGTVLPKGVYLYHPKYMVCDEKHPGTVIPDNQLTGDHGFVTFNDRGQEWTAAYTKVPVPGQEWYVVSALPTAEIMQSANTVSTGISSSVASLYNNFWMLVLISIVIVTVAALWISSQITKPVKHLTEVAEKISMGDTNVTVDVDSNDEIGVLAKAFDRMVISIKFLMSSEDVDKSA